MKKSFVAITLVGLLIGVGTGQANANGYPFADLGYGNATGQVVGDSLITGNSAIHATILDGSTPTGRVGVMRL